jgi:hypothetical protein
MTAELVLDDGTVSHSFLLDQGACSAPFLGALPYPATLRFLDADGQAIAETTASPEIQE